MTIKTKLMLLTLVASAAARADFSYTMTSKSSGAAGAGDQVTKQYIKGQKMVVDNSSIELILDFDAQTLTSINKPQKTYTVTNFSDVGKGLASSGTEVKVDVKETGQTKTINGFNASQVVMTMAIDSPQAQQAGLKLQMEMEIWVSPDVPGAGDLAAFYKRNADRFPWASMSSGANPSMRAAMADLQKKMASLKGVPVQQIIRVKNSNSAAGGAGADPRLAQARAQLEAMVKQGGPGAAQAQQALARMGGAAGGAGGSMFETTMESSNFSSAAIPDSVFAIPAGYTQAQK